MVTEQELNFGLVLHLDPDVLEAHGATYSCDEKHRVKGHHFFVCTGADEETGLWLPLYSNTGIGRIKFPDEGRSGHPKWTEALCYYHPDQVWTAPHGAIVRAAEAG